MREQTCCFTGHRKLPANAWKLKTLLLSTLMRVIEDNGMRDFICGGARGFDLMAAEMLLGLKPLYPDIRLIMALPCPPEEQTRGWPRDDLQRYQEILRQADQTVVVSPYFTKGCMHRRNRYLVEQSSYCICYLTRMNSGTSYTVNYAFEQNCTVENLALACPPKS